MERRFAQETEVPVEKSRAEIERLLQKNGATSFMTGSNSFGAMVAFEMHGRRIVFHLPAPKRDDQAVTHFRRGGGSLAKRSPDAAQRVWEQAYRSRWRALNLSVKAKLEAVAIGITTFEDEFLAHIVMPDGMSVGEHVRPRIAAAYDSGQMQPLLPGPKN